MTCFNGAHAPAGAFQRLEMLLLTISVSQCDLRNFSAHVAPGDSCPKGLSCTGQFNVQLTQDWGKLC